MSNAELASNWIPDVSAFGARLALVRWRMGWNLSEAERECGLTQNTWSGYETGKNPRDFVKVVASIVMRTRVDKVWLMTGEGSPVGPTGIEPMTSTV
ncbi:helix-turn-helix domain-containing protein [Rathayibacter soli]|uniref:helix-turn-helix domain-containing protein n=1 Tax=Rathayibacter soli TaxID=3144168 RepID=UPI0039080697